LPKIVAEIEELKKQILNQKMETMVKQRPSKQKFHLLGLDCGERSKMTFKPAPVNNGFTFVRVDLKDNPSLKQMQIMWSTRKEVLI
jgi:UDP-3-O-acyl-N-acetylglucosamine deacetylase